MALKTSTNPAEPAIKANEREAARMYERGVAAARGGQKRVAAVLLTRAVQLDPQHELGWLWLSGVLEDPAQIAFCLRTVLALNPNSQRARQGLEWLEQRNMLAAAAPAAPAAPAEEPAADAEGAELSPWRRRLVELPGAIRGLAQPQDERHAVYHGESWWVNWRRSRRALGRARLALWVVPVLLLLLTLALNSFLRGAVARNLALAQEAAARAAPTAQPVEAAPPKAPAVLLAELPPAADARVLAYLSAVAPLRQQLRDATQSYRNATSQPGGSSTAHAAAARRLVEQVDAASQALAALSPPPSLAQAHADYLGGLESERAALDDMLSFYGSFRIELANRAAQQMDDASILLSRAGAAFEQQRAAVAAQPVHPQTVR